MKPDLSPKERAAESLLLKERKSLIEKGIGRQFIKIRNQSLFVFNKLHAKVQNQRLELISMLLWNVHSLNNKLNDFQSYIYSGIYDIILR